MKHNFNDVEKKAIEALNEKKDKKTDDEDDDDVDWTWYYMQLTHFFMIQGLIIMKIPIIFS